MNNVPSFERLPNKRTVSRACLVVQEYAEVRVLICAGASLTLAADVQSPYSELCTEVDDPGENGGDENQDGSDRTPT